MVYPPSASEVSAEAAAAGGGALGSPRLRDFKLSNRKMPCFEIRIKTYILDRMKKDLFANKVPRRFTMGDDHFLGP
jgi:hypothetical protein